MIRYIDNITILARVNEGVILPPTLIARREDGSYQTVSVSWVPNVVNTTIEGEFIFEGTVSGYAPKVLCSVTVGEMDFNPPSAFPENIDQFGLPKQDLQSADVPDIDDYQYFKAKIPRTVTEEYQLKQLRELLADKIVLAKDINHQRNAIIALEEFALELDARVTDLEYRMTDLEDRVEYLEDVAVVGGRNVGGGAGVFLRKDVSNVLEFRTIVGSEGIEVTETGNTVTITGTGEGGGGDGETGCGVDVMGRTFTVCDSGVEFPTQIRDGAIKFSDFFGIRMVDVINNVSSSPDTYDSMLFVMGMGQSPYDQVNAARMIKATDRFLIEFKTETGYVGINLNKDTNSSNAVYNQGESMINEMVVGLDVYSPSVAIE